MLLNNISRSDDIRLALRLTYITLGWMTIEGAASLLLGWASKSLLLEAFGIVKSLGLNCRSGPACFGFTKVSDLLEQ
jgi:hypothetical protein